MRALAAGFAVLMVVGASVACGGGGGGSFPDETACPPPVPLPTSRANSGITSADAFTRRIQGSVMTLERLRSSLRSKYSEDTFYRRAEFRPDFAQYASETVCTAESMLQLSVPDARYAEYKSSLDAALADLVAHTRFGREAVKSRNVSEYRDWYEDADRKIAAVRVAANTAVR